LLPVFAWKMEKNRSTFQDFLGHSGKNILQYSWGEFLLLAFNENIKFLDLRMWQIGQQPKGQPPSPTVKSGCPDQVRSVCTEHQI
jgi:hypothetical protein